MLCFRKGSRLRPSTPHIAEKSYLPPCKASRRSWCCKSPSITVWPALIYRGHEPPSKASVGALPLCWLFGRAWQGAGIEAGVANSIPAAAIPQVLHKTAATPAALQTEAWEGGLGAEHFHAAPAAGTGGRRRCRRGLATHIARQQSLRAGPIKGFHLYRTIVSNFSPKLTTRNTLP